MQNANNMSQNPQQTPQQPGGQQLDPAQLAQISNIIKQIQTMISPQHPMESSSEPQQPNMQASTFAAQQSGDSNQSLKTPTPEEKGQQ